MLEGLIEFSNKFNNNNSNDSEDINIVTMENNTYAFFNCESDIYIILSISNKPSKISSNNYLNIKENYLFNKHVPNGASMLIAIKVIIFYYLL